MPRIAKGTLQYECRKIAVAYAKRRYEQLLAQVKSDNPNLPESEQCVMASRMFRWHKTPRSTKGDEFYIKELHAKCKKEKITRLSYDQWKKEFKITQNYLNGVTTSARNDLGWGIVQEASSTTGRKNGEMTANVENYSAIGAAVTTYRNGGGLTQRFEGDFKVIWETIEVLQKCRDYQPVPRLARSISSRFANNENEATQMAIADFTSNQQLLLHTRGKNLNVTAEELLEMTEEDIEHAVLKLVRRRLSHLDEGSREFLLEVVLRNITTKWAKHVLRWMIKCFEEKRCCLLRRVIDINATEPSNKRKRGGNLVVLPAAHFMVRYLYCPFSFHVCLLTFLIICCLFTPLTGPSGEGIDAEVHMHWTGEQSLRRCLHQCDANVSSF